MGCKRLEQRELVWRKTQANDWASNHANGTSSTVLNTVQHRRCLVHF